MKNSTIEELDSWKTLVQIASYIAVAFTILFGGIQIKIESQINKIQREESNSYQLQLSESKNERIKLEIELERTKKQISPRLLNKTQMNELKNIMLKYKNIEVEILSIGDPEAQQLLEQFEDICINANWKIKDKMTNANLNDLFDPKAKTFQGVKIIASNHRLGNELKSALESFDIKCKVDFYDSNKKEVGILVYEKPYHNPD